MLVLTLVGREIPLIADSYVEKDFDSEYASIGGWALERLGYIPTVGDSFEYNNISVKVEEMDDKRIVSLSVVFVPNEEQQ